MSGEDTNTHRNRPSLEEVPGFAQTSFARAFFDAGAGRDNDALQNIGAGDDLSTATPGFGVGPGGGEPLPPSSPAAAGLPPLPPATASSEADERMPSLPETDLNRKESWLVDYEEQMRAQGSDTHNAAAAAATNGRGDEGMYGNDSEVREQYRIMARHEAASRVKANLGYDPHEAAKDRATEEPDEPAKVRPPGPKPKEGKPLPPPRPQEPTLPPPRTNRRFLRQTAERRVPELCPGEIMYHDGDDSRGHQVGDDEHIVRCLSCSCGLKVKKLASLVSCPHCQTVSPASSTRQ